MAHLRSQIRRAFTRLMLVVTGCFTNALPAAEAVDFNSQIRPILSDRCYKCHGPDEQSRKAKLRLDTEEGSRAWVDKAKGLRAITPGKTDKSEVFHRITSNEAEEVMPPPDSNLKLVAGEIELLQKWIEQGAKYNKHWSFSPVEKPRVPATKDAWVRNPVDRFVLLRLKKANLQPSKEAAKEILIRRLSFDLTGLPPSPKQIDDFLNDTSPRAYEKLVERLLASSSYGEWMANEWLDLARYADTYGYQFDVERDMSPWRDWVIRSFNRNLPYNVFILWQIAGDLLANATDEQTLATAFNRLHRQTNEGGSIEEEFRVEYVADRVHTFGTAFLGLTLECARCHDHKYDPITQKDYYRLSAFFNNIDESGLYSHFTQATPSPTMLLYGTGQKETHADLKKKILAQEKELKGIAQGAKSDFRQWQERNPGITQTATPLAHFPFEDTAGNKVVDRSGKFSGALMENPMQTNGLLENGLIFNGESSVVFKELASFKRTDPFSFSLWLQPTEAQERAVVFHRSRSWTDSGSRGYELILEHGKPKFSLIHFWPGNAISIAAKLPLQLNEWTHLTVTYDGSSRASGMRIFINGEPSEHEVIRDNLFKDIVHRAEWGDMDVGNVHLTLGARFRDAGFKNGVMDEFAVFDRCLTTGEVAHLFQSAYATPLGLKDIPAHSPRVAPASQPLDLLRNPVGIGLRGVQTVHDQKPSASEHLFTSFLNRIHPAYTIAFAELSQLRNEENQLVNDIREIMVMREMPERRPTFLLKRGSYDAPAEAVQPGTPEDIFAFPNRLPRNRLGLAQWLTDRRNPLTARVAVNRVWKMHFGHGLVTTPEDFGSQGELPSHPELLDWLAADFMEHDWDLKRLHKLIVTSATYRQSSQPSAEAIAADPENIFLSRGPKHRLSAEQIRDAALACSGLLVEKVGGPSVKPYQPAGLWEQSGLSKTYVQDSGDNLYRRSLYTFWRRTSPPPSMTTFDATSREVCTAKRETTATPLQALVLLNDPQFVEAARVLAEQLMRDGRSLQSQITEAFRHVLGRFPQERESEIVERLHDEQLTLFTKHPEAAEKLLAVGQKARDASAKAPELAAMTLVVSTLMNHDEFVMKR
ncbi:MAG: DUF1553 domain-containing protein [Verrucomicrobia bacterium]|nr:DUF1553 domain-containing protein [Verrucomicrobiota bacterium]